MARTLTGRGTPPLLAPIALAAASSLSILATAAERGPPHDAVHDSARGTERSRPATAGLIRVGHRADMVILELMLDGKAVRTVSVTQGERVRLQVRTLQPTELHLHGYNLIARAGPVEPAVFIFVARHSGRFPIESHGTKDLLGRHEAALGYVEVRPE